MLSRENRLSCDKLWLLELCGDYFRLKYIVENVFSEWKPENFLTAILEIFEFFLAFNKKLSIYSLWKWPSFYISHK